MHIRLNGFIAINGSLIHKEFKSKDVVVWSSL